MILEDIFALDESSGYSLQGSFTPDLVFSKLWLMRELAKIQPQVSTMYVLGSWYGNLAVLLTLYPQIDVEEIINVETNAKFLKGSKNLLNQVGADNVEYMLKDANDLDYRQLDSNSVVVNTSLNDIKGTDWFENIPSGTLVAMQARNQVENEQFAGPESIEQKFPLDQVLYSGSLDLEDPETEYTRFMIIGIK
jgi:hypothetical protein